MEHYSSLEFLRFGGLSAHLDCAILEGEENRMFRRYKHLYNRFREGFRMIAKVDIDNVGYGEETFLMKRTAVAEAIGSAEETLENVVDKLMSSHVPFAKTIVHFTLRSIRVGKGCDEVAPITVGHVSEDAFVGFEVMNNCIGSMTC